jgi:ABC-2 type transport system ATP-binding protein
MIEVKNLQFGYSKKRKLFKDLSLSLEAGHIYGLLGKNGAGKTSLLKLIGGMLFAEKGSYSVVGFSPSRREPNFLSDIFYIPEDIYTNDQTVKDFVLSNSPFYPKFDLGNFLSYIKEFEIGYDEKLSKLSFGQKKKAIIAFGLATCCSVLILDEPTNGLDIPSKSQFRKIVASVATEDRCIIISTHQVRDLDNLIDTVIILDEGEIAINEPVDAITEKLLFKTVPLEQSGSAIYGEPSLKGFTGVFYNTNNEPCKLDMEILFNSVLAQKSTIKGVFIASQV